MSENTLLIDGRTVSQALRREVAVKASAFKEKHGRSPCLAVILVGDVKASHVYVRNKEKACAEAGIESIRIDLPADLSQATLDETLRKLNTDPKVDGILVQLPLPPQISSERVQAVLSSEKDADGFTYGSLGYFFAGRKIVAPCTPAGVMELLKFYNIPVKGKHAVVVGRSLIVGKPMAQLLLEADATVTVCHSRTPNIAEMTRQGDIVVAAAGQRHLFGKEHFKKGAVVIDVGIHGSGTGTGVTGDVRSEELQGWASALTPVPGGVGPMTIALLLQNTIALAERRMGART